MADMHTAMAIYTERAMVLGRPKRGAGPVTSPSASALARNASR